MLIKKKSFANSVVEFSTPQSNRTNLFNHLKTHHNSTMNAKKIRATVVDKNRPASAQTSLKASEYPSSSQRHLNISPIPFYLSSKVSV